MKKKTPSRTPQAEAFPGKTCFFLQNRNLSQATLLQVCSLPLRWANTTRHQGLALQPRLIHRFHRGFSLDASGAFGTFRRIPENSGDLDRKPAGFSSFWSAHRPPAKAQSNKCKAAASVLCSKRNHYVQTIRANAVCLLLDNTYSVGRNLLQVLCTLQPQVLGFWKIPSKAPLFKNIKPPRNLRTTTTDMSKSPSARTWRKSCGTLQASAGKMPSLRLEIVGQNGFHPWQLMLTPLL